MRITYKKKEKDKRNYLTKGLLLRWDKTEILHCMSPQRGRWLTIRFVKHMNIAMRDAPPCVIPETKHCRNTPPRQQQYVHRVQQYGRQERKKKRKKEQKTISILFTFSWIYRSTSFRKLQKNGLLSIQSPEAKRFDVYAYRYSKLTVVSIFNCTEQTRTASSDGIIRILTNTLVTQ